MAKVTKFEDLICWQKSRILVKEIYNLTDSYSFKNQFALKEQIRKAALSVLFNIAEGFSRRSNKEFKMFLFISHGSIAEVQSALYVAMDLQLVQKTFLMIFITNAKKYLK